MFSYSQKRKMKATNSTLEGEIRLINYAEKNEKLRLFSQKAQLGIVFLDSDLDSFSRSNPGLSLVYLIVPPGFNSKLALIDGPITIANYSELG